MHRGRAAVLASLATAAVVGLAWWGAAIARDMEPASAGSGSAVPIDAPLGPVAKAVNAGRHVRIEGPRGPIHVWIPAGYHADTGATILYIHGYWDDTDTAWVGHQLPEQFALAGQNALFIAPEAPVAARTPVNYPDLGELLRIVEEKTGVVRGAALTAVVGHSGAFRTMNAWLDEALLDQMIWIDAMYGDEDIIVNWYNASPRRRLIIVGEDTILGTEAVVEKLPAGDCLTIDRFPPTWETYPAAAKRARCVYVRAQYMHMPLVTEGFVLPAMLRLLPVELLPDHPWHLPLGSLPPLADAASD
ncbi:MAG: hypothetical protein KIT31_28080 [Deltaproteobacteria bacterium]|nr:hypothetical protein [Deltaproteobacteria bacterium]